MAFFVPLLAAVGGGSALAGGAAVASTALAAGSAIAQSRAAKAATAANTSMMTNQANLVRQQGVARQEANSRRTREILGAQRAAIAQAGGGFGGSAQDVLEQSATNAALDDLNIGYEAELQARGLMSQSAVNQWEGTQQAKGAYIKAGTTILGSTANYFGRG